MWKDYVTLYDALRSAKNCGFKCYYMGNECYRFDDFLKTTHSSDLKTTPLQGFQIRKTSDGEFMLDYHPHHEETPFTVKLGRF